MKYIDSGGNYITHFCPKKKSKNYITHCYSKMITVVQPRHGRNWIGLTRWRDGQEKGYSKTHWMHNLFWFGLFSSAWVARRQILLNQPPFLSFFDIFSLGCVLIQLLKVLGLLTGEVEQDRAITRNRLLPQYSFTEQLWFYNVCFTFATCQQIPKRNFLHSVHIFLI